jgi:actin-related protein
MKSVSSESQTVILDSGSGCTKIGYSTDTLPLEVFPTLIGRPILRPKSYTQKQ